MPCPFRARSLGQLGEKDLGAEKERACSAMCYSIYLPGSPGGLSSPNYKLSYRQWARAWAQKLVCI